MLGQLILERGGGGKAELGELYGLRVLQVRADPEGWLARRKLKRAGRTLRQGGVLRTLAPKEFQGWELMSECGLSPVNPMGFLRSQGALLALGALERQGLAPDRSEVALRGPRAGQELARTAVELCAQVRRLVIDAPVGGQALAEWLRQEFGVPVLPKEEFTPVDVCFGPGDIPEKRGREGMALRLYGSQPDLAGLTLTAPALEPEDRERLPLLAALWEGGRLPRGGLKIT